ncbi:dipeptidyl-peptidase 3 family protein [Kangiella spongicola]|uniref:Zn-dependent hydrolase n=1 Tax=Kangiella spongicola TaxID=796379 RepID=A0A318D8W1_9GAMM|nr:Zn-dependent hydrolase [Kangiella spongicola]PXF62569.1 Zn-dependent hydrolase [Kangiella spongicola]
MKKFNNISICALSFSVLMALGACSDNSDKATEKATNDVKTERALVQSEATQESSDKVNEEYSRFDIYAPFTLTSDLSHLSDNQKEMIGLLIEAGEIMDGLFWKQAYGNKQELLASIEDPKAKKFAQINYGPWDRLDNNKPFLEGYDKKSKGAEFYPDDMTVTEFENWEQEGKKGLYTLVRRDDKGNLALVPYSTAFKEELLKASELLHKASELAEDKDFKNYLKLRADALITDNYQPSDFAWMDMKNNPVEVVIGPIETYEDQLFGYRASFSAYVLIKDLEWSERLSRFAAFLPELQKGLPVEQKYKQEMPGTDSDLNAYDVVFYAGDSNAGSKTIAINLPNDEKVQLAKGTRRLQLKNAMRAKFDKILVPIADELIAEDQRKHITFDAFFANTMFHEVAHGLGIKNTINDKGTVRSALKETASALEEGKADILGLYMISKLYEKGEIKEGELMDNYVTFLAGIFRSVRFGASSAHGKANMVRFNFFKDKGAFERDEETGQYSVNFDKMTQAMNDLSETILVIQGNGDYEAAKNLLNNQGGISKQLAADLKHLEEKQIPVDVTFKQGKEVLGLK